MSNKKIVFASILGAILTTGLLALNPSMVGNAGAQMYRDHYGYDSNYYYQDDNKYGYDNNHQKKSSHVDIQKIKCVNSNINVNGIDITQIPQDGTTTAESANEGSADAANTENGNGLTGINLERNLVNICVNVNHNEQVKVSTPEEEPGPCETCFTTHLTAAQQQFVLENAEQGDTFAEICEFLQENENNPEESDIVFNDIGGIPGITETQQNALYNCLVQSGVIEGMVV
jgi:hypothetical protein